MWLCLWIGLALAQDGVDVGVGEDGLPEIRVYGERALEQSKRLLFDQMKDLGWSYQGRHDGDWMFRHDKRWKGKVLLSPEGTVDFARFLIPDTNVTLAPKAGGPDHQTDFEIAMVGDHSVAAFEGPRPFTPQLTFTPVGQRKRQGFRDRTLGSIHPYVAHYRDVLAETRHQAFLAELPIRLDELWGTGLPLEGDAPLLTPTLRRLAVLDYWSSRADTREGGQVCATVETWLEEVVQASPFPVTVAEQAACNDAAQHTRRLALPGLAQAAAP